MRRSLRVGELTGTPVEDLGIVPEHRHELTRRDVLEGNLDLLDAAGALLAAMPKRALRLTSSLDGAGTLTLQVTTEGIRRLDVYVDSRPRASADVPDGGSILTVPGLTGAAVVRVEGYAGGELVAARTQQL
jgi:hypothetical protein